MFKLLIDAAELKLRVGTPGWLIFDVRHDLADHHAGRKAYEEAHIPGALYLDHEQQLVDGAGVRDRSRPAGAPGRSGRATGPRMRR